MISVEASTWCASRSAMSRDSRARCPCAATGVQSTAPVAIATTPRRMMRETREEEWLSMLDPGLSAQKARSVPRQSLGRAEWGLHTSDKSRCDSLTQDGCDERFDELSC